MVWFRYGLDWGVLNVSLGWNCISLLVVLDYVEVYFVLVCVLLRVSLGLG